MDCSSAWGARFRPAPTPITTPAATTHHHYGLDTHPVRPDHCVGEVKLMRSSEKRVRRLRLLITILLAAAALVSAAATLSDRLHLQLWGSLTVLLTLLAVLAPTFQGWLKQAQ